MENAVAVVNTARACRNKDGFQRAALRDAGRHYSVRCPGVMGNVREQNTSLGYECGMRNRKAGAGALHAITRISPSPRSSRLPARLSSPTSPERAAVRRVIP